MEVVLLRVFRFVVCVEERGCMAGLPHTLENGKKILHLE